MNQLTLKPINIFILSVSVLSISFSSCGGGQKSLADLKSKEAELKTELADITQQIKLLEGDSSKKFILVQAQPVTPSIFKTYIKAQGRVDAEESVSISTEMPGTVTKINVRVGESVAKGQVLAETDTRALQQSLSDLQTNSELVNQLYEKQKTLWEQKIGTEVQFLQAKTQKESMEKKISSLQEQIRMTKIISPINGVVDAVDIKIGQSVAPGMPAMRVINFNNLKIKADIAESYASKVHIGDEVLVKFPDTGDTLLSKITYAARAISQLNRTFGVEVLLDNKKRYHPNQIVLIDINDYKSDKPTIVIPVKYTQKDVKGLTFVYIMENNKAVKRTIVLGKEFNGQVEIKEGLKETDALITLGYDGLNEGDDVKLIN